MSMHSNDEWKALMEALKIAKDDHGRPRRERFAAGQLLDDIVGASDRRPSRTLWSGPGSVQAQTWAAYEGEPLD